MPKQVIVIMEDNYPFGECEQCTNQYTRVLVRKIYSVSLQQKNKLLEKVNILRKLKNQHMIKIQSVLEEEESVHFLFQYIPIKLQTWISNINDQFIQNFRDQLIKFSSFLANNYIKIDFQLKNIGMDQNYGAKYFLDLDFEVDNSINRQKLKSTYIREITNLFRPYILHSNQLQNNIDYERQKALNTNDNKHLKVEQGKLNNMNQKNDAAISPPTNKITSKHKEKALEKYYQDVNMSVDSENQKILQQFMDVLDNEEEQDHRGHSTHSTQHTKQTNSYSTQQKNMNINESKGQGSSNNINQKQVHVVNQNLNSGQFTKVQNIQHQQASNREHSAQREEKEEEINSSEASDLQFRVKNAIEKSMTVIKKFKTIKDNSMI